MYPEIHTISGIPTAIFDSAPKQSSEAVVFVHGNPGPMDDWSQLIEVTAPFIRTVAMDLPGFGRSAHPKNFDYSVSGYVEHLSAIIKQLELSRIHLVLHDFGGAFGAWWALANPNKVASITLINTGVLPGYSWHIFARLWQAPIIGELFSLASTPKAVHTLLDLSNPKPFPKKFLDHVTRYADWNNKKAVLKLYRATRNPDSLFGPELIQKLKPHDFKACVIWGEQDRYLPVRYAEIQRQAFPSAEIHTIPRAGHWPFIDEPKLVATVLVSFLQNQRSNDSTPTTKTASPV